MSHRADAVVAIRVGAYADGYASVVKTVTTPQLDRAPLLAYVEQQKAPAVADAPPPPPGRAAANAPGIQSVAPADLSAWVRQSKGWVVVQLSSYDPGCGYCTRSNPAFNSLAAAEASQGLSFARVAFQPWKTVGQNDFVRHSGLLHLQGRPSDAPPGRHRRRGHAAPHAAGRAALTQPLASRG